jgi:hypothetical protein
MNIRMVAAVFAGLMLCGCSYWDDTMSYVGLGSSDEDAQPVATPAAEAAPAPMPSSQYSTNEDWCRQIARAASEEAAGEGLDLATQQHKADTAYQQCVAPAGQSSR